MSVQVIAEHGVLTSHCGFWAGKKLRCQIYAHLDNKWCGEAVWIILLLWLFNGSHIISPFFVSYSNLAHKLSLSPPLRHMIWFNPAKQAWLMMLFQWSGYEGTNFRRNLIVEPLFTHLPPHPPPPQKNGPAKSPPRCFPGWRGVRFQGPLTWPRHPLAPVDLDVGRYLPPGNWGQKMRNLEVLMKGV